MGTSLYDAVVLGSQSVRRQGADRRRAVVIITDAGETTSVSKFEDARRAAIASDTLLYTVVVRPMKSDGGWNTAGEHAIETITDSTGGAMYYPTDLTELNGIFDRINKRTAHAVLAELLSESHAAAGEFAACSGESKHGRQCAISHGIYDRRSGAINA